MYEIPNINDKIEALHIYLKANKDEGEAWYYQHNPTVVKFINLFDKSDCWKLNSEIWDWAEETLYNLADPLLEVENENLDANLLYGRIFLHINNIKYEEYLVQNIYLLNDGSNWSRPKEFYSKIKEKIQMVSTKIGRGDYTYCLDQINLRTTAENNG